MRGRLAGLLALLIILIAPRAWADDRPFADWTAVIVAADWRGAHDQRPISAFENARRDLAAAFVDAGFAREHVRDFSLSPIPASRGVAASDLLAAGQAAADAAQGGCLLYFTSHGSPEGIVFGPDRLLSPAMMRMLVQRWCAARPAVVVVSACYSGVFVPALQAPNRMVMTAARRDRPSFGCSEEERHTYFDGCVLQSLPDATDFIHLGVLVRACVARREAEAGTPASEPQIWAGPEAQLDLPFRRFERPPVRPARRRGS